MDLLGQYDQVEDEASRMPEGENQPRVESEVHGAPARPDQREDKAEKVYQAMTNFLEIQGAGQSRSAYEHFMKFLPEHFHGEADPTKAENWLKQMEDIFEVMNESDHMKVILTAFMLRGEAKFWWDAEKRLLGFRQDGISAPLTWEKFKNSFNDKYFPLSYRYEKEQEFIELKQNNLLVSEYEAKFTALTRFAPDLVKDEAAKCRRFQQGLELPIRSRISALEINKYAELVNKEKIVEKDVHELSGRREQAKKSRFESTQSYRSSLDAERQRSQGSHTNRGQAISNASRGTRNSAGQGFAGRRMPQSGNVSSNKEIIHLAYLPKSEQEKII